ncbi:MAG: hypothetical protein KAR83_08525 [Thermodesulfovibrionales bacterium]|nr:hypothetical protein [Thermodesulfovibrionales bacterium]
MPPRLDPADYPGLDPLEAGRHPILCYGEVEGVRAQFIDSGATALLSADISAEQTTVQVEDASRFPPTPFTAQVGYERMLVTDITGDTLTVTRGHDNTTARAHLRNKTIYEVCAEYVCLVSPEPVKGISRIFVDGRRQSKGYTAYTGKSGDEHADWPGKAVVAFSAGGWIGPQRGLETEPATTREKGQSLESAMEWASHPELVDGSGSSFVLLSMTGTPMAQVAFSDGDGVIRKQEYSVTVENMAASEAALKVAVSDPQDNSVMTDRMVHLPASTKLSFKVSEPAGAWQRVLTLTPIDEDVRVFAISRKVTRLKLPQEDDALVSIGPAPAGVSDSRVDDDLDSGAALSSVGRLSAWAAYSSTGPGEAFGQTHSAEVKNTGGADAVVRLVSAEPGGACHAVSKHTIGTSQVETLAHTHSGGAWDTMTTVVVETGEVEVRSLAKGVEYATEETLSSRSLAHSCSVRAVIGDSVTVDLEGVVDTDDSYAGTGTLIERPDHVIKHFLIERMGFNSSDIDTASFSAAGDSFAAAVTDGYRFAFAIDSAITPSEFIRRLAFECRSTIRYTSGEWQLAFIPDSAPAAVKAIARGELAGEGSMFVFSKTPPGELANRITARYKKNYSADRGQSKWGALATVEDAASQAARGVYSESIEFHAIRDKATAEDVLAHMLLGRRDSLLLVRFPVFWEHFDLEVGDTIEIENDLYDGSLFFIESIERLDRFRARITARQWWG